MAGVFLFAAIVYSFGITILVVGGLLYISQTSNLKSVEQSIQQQTVLLQQQINELKQSVDNQKKTETEQVQLTSKQADDQDTAKQINNDQELSYTNQKYQFSLTLPETWKGYTVSEAAENLWR